MCSAFVWDYYVDEESAFKSVKYKQMRTVKRQTLRRLQTRQLYFSETLFTSMNYFNRFLSDLRVSRKRRLAQAQKCT